MVSSTRRLLVVAESLGVGGTETHLLRLLPRIVANGWSVAVFCLTERGERASQLEASGIEVFCTKRRGSRKRPRLLYLTHVTSAARELLQLFRHWRPTIAHFYLPGPYVIGAPAAIFVGTPIKIMSRRSLSCYQRTWPLVAQIERQLHKRMDMLIGNSHAVTQELIGEGVPESKLKLIYNGVDASEPFPDRGEARRELGLDQDALVGVVVANLIHYKGHPELIEGLGQVAPRLPRPWYILLAGCDHGLRAKLESLVKEHELDGNVLFLGGRPDIPRLLAAADFGILTSREEGFSNVILEYMSAGLPAIVTGVGGNPEAVINECTGLIVPPKDPTAIGEAVLRLARDPDLRSRLGTAGQRRVVQEFSVDRCVAAHTALYEEALGNLQRRRPLQSNKPIKLLLLTRYSRKGPSSRVRFMQYAPRLAEQGIEVDLAPLLPEPYLDRRYQNKAQSFRFLVSAYLQRLNTLLHSSRYDVIWLEKEALPGIPAWCERILFRKPLVLDIDDAWHLRYSEASNPIVRYLLGRKIETLARVASVVTVSNPYLQHWAEKAGARSIEFIPTVVDTQRYPATPLPPADPFTVGWIGTPSTAMYLEEIRSALQKTLSRPNSRLLLIGAGNFSLPGVEVEVHPWSEDRENFLLQQIHVGIMPLRSGAWEQAKSAYKAIQYMAAGRPVLASPVGTCNEVLEEGISGFFATDADSWVALIERLRDNPFLASKMGRAGRERVELYYSLEHQVSTVATLLRSAAT